MRCVVCRVVVTARYKLNEWNLKNDGGTTRNLLSHRIHVRYIYLHLVDFKGKCRQIYQSHGSYGYSRVPFSGSIRSTLGGKNEFCFGVFLGGSVNRCIFGWAVFIIYLEHLRGAK